MGSRTRVTSASESAGYISRFLVSPRVGLEWERAPPRVIGHRGSPREAPENTLASFEAAHRAGAHAVELDVRLTADERVVIHHDDALGRIIAGEGSIEALESAILVAKGIPLLSSVLRSPLLVDVEIKADAANAGALPAAVLDVVRREGALDRVLVTSFDHELADEYARLAGRPAGMIVPYPPEEELASFPRLTFVALAADAALPEVIQACVRASRRVLVWTVNDEASARAHLARGASGIITDRPGPLVRSLAEDEPVP